MRWRRDGRGVATLGPAGWHRLKHMAHRRDRYRCAYCGHQMSHRSPELTIDHRIPVSRGGDNNLPNLATCCAGCNAAKGTLTSEEFVAATLVRP